MKHVDNIVPCYNEESCVRLLYEAVDGVFSDIKDYTYSLLYVDDGSSDHTAMELKSLSDSTPNVQYISFARNFGKEGAIYAGLSNSIGDYIVLMDADLQHPPELIPKMLEGMEEGYDCVGARRTDRKGEPIIRSVFSKLFYGMINKMTEMHLVQGGSDYRMMSRRMVDAMLQLTERERFTKGIMSWVGFETKWITYDNVERMEGESKWSFWGLMRYAISGFIAFATAPLRIVIYQGLIIVGLSVIYAIHVFAGALRDPYNRSGYATIVILLLFLGGMIITLLGVIGEYIARLYMEIKHRPIYIEKENTRRIL